MKMQATSKDNIADFMSTYYPIVREVTDKYTFNKISNVFWPREPIGDTAIIIFKIRGRNFKYDDDDEGTLYST